ncbi:hypothetical protein [Streptacidiphilus sp. MAP12-20]|uniref:hypothetical protein n=1 Tax=Streptacidiphilus sp. MAP12-20 TaxID=3156299 RepID=UPI0035116C4C
MSGFRGPPHGLLDDLDFAADAVTGLATVLQDGFGFSVKAVTTPGLTTADLGRLVRRTLKKAGADTVLLVHLLTHGEAKDGSLYALGADALLHESTDIGGWLTGLQHVEGRPVVLFTLDLCNSGMVTQLPWQAHYDRSGRRGWVVAACEPQKDAFNGHFTMALTEVLGDMAAQRTPLTPRTPYIPLGTLVDAVRRATVKLADTNRVYRQYVTTSRVEVSDEAVVLPLFPNPAYLIADASANGASGPALGADRRLSAFLDDADDSSDDDSDLRHFVDSVAGLNGFHDSQEGFGASFTGRAHELRRLSRWLGGDGTSPAAVVTGSPGAGKSALLGLVVCAAHPKLRDSTRTVWEKVGSVPLPLGRLGVAHARGCGLEALAGKLARQLGLETLGPEQLLAALVAQDLPPTLVIDALDEADDAAAVCDWLTRAAALTRSDGSAAIRLLVATRTSEESAELRDLAAGADHCFDLDQVASSELEADLHAYVSRMLRSTPEYHGLHQTVGAFAGALAETLVANRGSGQGEFLVAGLFTRHFLASFDPRAGSDEAERLGYAAPRSPSEVLDLDLAHRSAGPWLRPVLTALAHARGDGMPASVVQRAAAALRPGPVPSPADIQDALTAGYTYLRRSVDVDAITVHRLFHDELAQHLRRDEDAERVFRALLDGLGPAEYRQWPAAEPYLLRHALSHAGHRESPEEGIEAIVGDPGYLLHADPARYLPSLTESVRRVVTRWRCAAPTVDRRRMALALAAVEEGRPDLARRTANLPGEQPLPWLPLWADSRDGGGAASAGLAVAALTGRGDLRSWNWELAPTGAEDAGAPRALAFGRVEGRNLLVVGTSGGRLAIADSSGRTTVWPWHSVAVTALAVADRAGTQVVVSGSSDGEVNVHELATGGQVGATVRIPDAVIGAISAVGHGASLAVACVSGSGHLHSWICGEAETPVLHSWSTTAPVRSVAVGRVGERLVLVAGCGDGATVVWDMQTHTLKRTLRGSHGPANSVAVGELGARRVAVVGSEDGYLTIWDLETFQQLGEAIPVDREPIRSLSLTRGRDDELCCLIGGDGPTTLWSLDRRTLLRNFGQSGVVHADLAAAEVSLTDPTHPTTPLVSAVGALTEAVAVYGDEDGACYVVDATTGRRTRAPLAGDGHAVSSVEEITLGGTAAVLLRSARTCRVWDIASGAHSDHLPWQDEEWPSPDLRLGTAFVGGDLVTASVGADGEVRIGEHLAGRHQGEVTVLRAARLGGRPVAVSGGVDGTVRTWDLEERRPLDVIDFGRPVSSLAPAADGLLLVVAGGQVYALEHLVRRFPS